MITENISIKGASVPFTDYLQALRGKPSDQSTEHTYRADLEKLLEAIAGGAFQIIHEPARSREGLGAPDFQVKSKGQILGYIETKSLGENLTKALKSAQIEKYKKLTHNLLLTNYLDWLWIRPDQDVVEVNLVSAGKLESKRFTPDAQKIAQLDQLLKRFFAQEPRPIGRADDLAEALAMRSHDLREFFNEELKRQQQEKRGNRLTGLYDTFHRNYQLTQLEFADAFAQMLAYGLFLARLNAEHPGKACEPLTLFNAASFIPTNFELIRELVGFLSELTKPEYKDVSWAVDEILSILNNLNVRALRQDLSFNHKPLSDKREEAELFKKDPYVYFYEDFLGKYDAKLRKAKGVYYTPPPVVGFIIRAIHDLLKETFGLTDGLAAPRVTLLDFATGTGTFLLAAFQQIFDELPQGSGKREKLIQTHLLKDFYGFEYLMAPYTIAHLKLSQFLKSQGYDLHADERLQVYLANTLEALPPQEELFMPALSHESKQAHAIKKKPILVITGNPPYSGHSQNNGEWMRDLLKGKDTLHTPARKTDNYFEVDGQSLGERNPKWLNDDYVKFIRFAQWKMEQVDEGIVGIITNHSWLDNPTFRGMRQSLMKTFNQIYILDLHGNAKKKEVCPDGSKDENVFDIQQGVAIAIFIKKKGLSAKYSHADFWGLRKRKYIACTNNSLETIKWARLKPNKPFYFLSQQNEKGRKQYDTGWSVRDIFPLNNTGIVSKRDKIAFHFEQNTLIKVLKDFQNLPEEELKRKYEFKESRDGKVDFVKIHILEYGIEEKFLQKILYRPFDKRWTYYTDKSKGFLGWPVYDVMRHMLAGENVGLIATRVNRQVRLGYFFAANQLTDFHILDSAGDSTYLFPLYLYPEPGEQKGRKGELSFEEPNLQKKTENFSLEFRKFIDTKYKRRYTPEEIFGYIYAVLHAPGYREKYKEFLKSDFPRVPFVDDRKKFEKLSALGWELAETHLMRDGAINQLKRAYKNMGAYMGKGNDTVEYGKFALTGDKKLYINQDNYFANIPLDVWEFHIGGYQVIDKYLKSRKSRKLSLDEINTIETITQVLAFTIEQMKRIDSEFASTLVEK